MATGAEWLTLAEIARRLDRRLSTLASRRDAYRTRLEERRDERGRAIYRVDSFREMDRLMAVNAGKAEIGRVLDALREDAPPAESFETAMLDRMDRLIEAVERTATAVERIADHLDPPPAAEEG